MNVFVYTIIIIALSCITVKSQVLEFNLSNPDIPQLFTISIVSYNKINNAEGKSELNIELRLRLNEPASIKSKVKTFKFKANAYELLLSTVLYDSNQIEIKDVPINFKIEDFPTIVTLSRKRKKNIEVTYPVILIIPKTVDFKYIKWFDFPVLELK
ncbi:MAG: hypothetical protein KAT48_09710 [Bacteroidales bacterium]|nr:hypothetical protein [Bacteroidales bacterium]